MNKILAVGIATVDIINTVEHYPGEDEEVRAQEQSIRRGGNASNTLVLLAALGYQCSWAGVLADDLYADFIRDDLMKNDINIDHAVVQHQSSSPLSCITLAQGSGKRSIVHYRDVREYSFADFKSVDINEYDWLHFEGRNVEQTIVMLEYMRASNFPNKVSIEIEKPRQDIERLFAYADILIFSKGYAQHAGFNDASAFLGEMHRLHPDIVLYCAWGKGGAYAIDRQGMLSHAQAQQDIEVVDTVGAGDAFNAGVIDANLSGLECQQGLQAACKLAARKCMQYGFAGVVEEQQ